MRILCTSGVFSKCFHSKIEFWFRTIFASWKMTNFSDFINRLHWFSNNDRKVTKFERNKMEARCWKHTKLGALETRKNDSNVTRKTNFARTHFVSRQSSFGFQVQCGIPFYGAIASLALTQQRHWVYIHNYSTTQQCKIRHAYFRYRSRSYHFFKSTHTHFSILEIRFSFSYFR